MSYKTAVLYDYPIAYYPLDDSTTVDLVTDYTDLLAEFSSYQDILDNVTSYASLYGDIAYDHSGCENDSLYIGDPESNILPLVVGNNRATKITSLNSIQYKIENDYTANPTNSQFATASSSDNDFTIEFWFYPSINTTNITPLVADDNENIGVFYDKGNILFKVDSESVSYTLPNIKKAFHVACIYSNTSIYIYVDGEFVAYKTLSNFTFTNSTVSFKSGPTLNASDYFLINSVAIYRYGLSQNRIQFHIYEGKGILPLQIAAPESGEVFSIYDNDISTVYKHSYPADKSFDQIVVDGLTYNQDQNYLELTKTESPTSATVVINDYLPVPTTIAADSSKIEWDGDNGITVLVSTDGTIYNACTNGGQIPGYTLNSFGSPGLIYLRIVFSSTDTTKYLPRLRGLSASFYNNQKIYAENGSSYITTLENDVGVSDYRVTFGLKKYEALSRNYLNGLKTVTDSGFHIVTTNSVRTLEFFYTPSALTDSGLVSTTATNGYAASNYSWRNTGVVSKTNISAIYVNGVNVTSQTNISNVFKDDELHHVVIVFGSAVSGEIRFNYSLYGSVPALYQYISMYPEAFTNTNVSDHYNKYILGNTSTVTDTSTITMTEDGTEAYNNTWLVIQTT